MSRVKPAHKKSMERVMAYCVKTRGRVLEMKAAGKWNGVDKWYKFEIGGMSDSDFTKDVKTRQSVTKYITLLIEAVSKRVCHHELKRYYFMKKINKPMSNNQSINNLIDYEMYLQTSVGDISYCQYE